ncbi:hypothetical protein HDV00_012832 [Rhizophlyctis rosea]|nr:hypothetical protein HDV00_012832 [Rhizophlyctis rosea]
MDYEGIWSLCHDESDFPDEMLAKQGLPWLARVAIKRAPMTITITSTPAPTTPTVLTIKPPLGPATTLILNGESQRTTFPVTGVVIHSTAYVDENNRIVEKQEGEQGDWSAETVWELVDGGRRQNRLVKFVDGEVKKEYRAVFNRKNL